MTASTIQYLLLASVACTTLFTSPGHASSARARTWHVSTSGVDYWPGGMVFGTSGMPLETIDRAIDLADDGDTIRIHAGTHQIDDTLEIDGKSLSFVGDVRSDGGPAAILEGAQFLVTEGAAGNTCSFANLVLREAPFHYAISFNWNQQADQDDDWSITITNSAFSNNLVDVSADSVRIVDSSFSDQYHGVLVYRNLLVDRCSFLGGDRCAVQTGFGFDWSQEVEVRSSRFSGYRETPLCHQYWGLGHSAALYHDLVVSNNDDGGVLVGAEVLISDCEIRSNGGSGVVCNNLSPYHPEGSFSALERAGCLIIDSTISDNGEFGVYDDHGDDRGTRTLEGFSLRNSIVCGNDVAQVRAAYTYGSGSGREVYFNSTQHSVYSRANYWMGTDHCNVVRSRCSRSIPGGSFGGLDHQLGF